MHIHIPSAFRGSWTGSLLGSITHVFQISGALISEKEAGLSYKAASYGAKWCVSLTIDDAWERRSSRQTVSSSIGYVTWRDFEASPHGTMHHSSGVRLQVKNEQALIGGECSICMRCNEPSWNTPI